MIRLIAAIDINGGLARNGQVPWDLPDELKYFAAQTKLYGGNVLTGKKTYLTYPNGPLPNRRNFVLSRGSDTFPGTELVNNLEVFLSEFREDLWIAGGEVVFKRVFELNKADEVYLTKIDKDFKCDQFFPDEYKELELVEQSAPQIQNGLSFTYCKYVKKIIS
jgi:dihydrofolate reductase